MINVTILGFVVASLSLVISVTTAWLTLWRRGTVRMAQPPTIYFGPDGAREHHGKVFIRGLLYSTSIRGHIVEGMYARLRRGDWTQTLPVWVCGSSPNDLTRGAGLSVTKEGMVRDHHFLLPRDGSQLAFLPGSYELEVFVVLVGRRRAQRLQSVTLSVTESQSAQLHADRKHGLYFDWSPETMRYNSHVNRARLPEPAPLRFTLDGRNVEVEQEEDVSTR